VRRLAPRLLLRTNAMNPRRALSLKQPNAEQILRGDKVAEYRDRPTRIRERVYIYASRTPGPIAEFAKLNLRPGDLPTGVLVGTVDDCVVDFGLTERASVLADVKQVFQIFPCEETKHFALC